MSTHINKMPRLNGKHNKKNISQSNRNNNNRKSCHCRACNVNKQRFWGPVATDTLEAFLVLMLLFTLLPVVYGIVTDTQSTTIELKRTNQKGDAKQQPQTQTQTTNGHSEPHFQINRTSIVELFEWKFSDVAKECEEFLGPKGYAGVQLSPVTEHVKAQTSWQILYKPISYIFATRLGSIEDFLEMSRICNTAGVRVYVDVVLNHMVGEVLNETLLEGLAGSMANVSALEYGGVPFAARHFHKPCPLENYVDAHEVRNCQLNGQPDLDHSKVEVRQHIVTFLNELIEMGVAGFRIDAAKCIWPVDLKVIYAAVNDLNSEEFDFPENSRPFFYQEVVDLGMDAVSKTEYAGYGMVTDYLYAAEISTIFKGKVPLSTLINWGPAMGFLAHQDALVFVDTHESQHGALERELGQNQLLNFQQHRQYVMATLFMLAHPYGRVKRIMSSYYYNENDKESGPPVKMVANNDDDNVDGNMSEESIEVIGSPEFDVNQQCTIESGWVCEHRWPAFVNMLTLVNTLSPTEDVIIDFQTFGPNHIAFCRGQKAFIAINNDNVLDYTTTVHTCLEQGIYCDVISGGRNAESNDCNGKRIVVNEHGMTDLALPALGNDEIINSVNVNITAFDYGVIAIYIGSKLVDGDTEVQLEVVEADLNVMETTTIKLVDDNVGGDDIDEAIEVDTFKNETVKVDKR